MLFWSMPLCFIIFGVIYAIGWFFNAEYYRTITRIFWVQLAMALLGHLYLLPIFAYNVHFDASKNIEDIKTIYWCFLTGLVIITFGQALLYYRKTYIMVDKS